MKPTPKDLSFIKSDDLLMAKIAIDFYSAQKNNEKRIYFGNLYNRIGKVQYLATNLDEEKDILAAKLAELEKKYIILKQEFKNMLGYDYRFIKDMRNEHFKNIIGN